jgi:site-specific DNA-methyltransferase (adenine-specific)
LTLTASEQAALAKTLLRPPLTHNAPKLTNEIVIGDAMRICPELPKACVDLLILDPPYNLTKKFGGETFRETSLPEYELWFESWFVRLLPVLKPSASLYVCGDWKSSTALHRVLDRHDQHLHREAEADAGDDGVPGDLAAAGRLVHPPDQQQTGGDCEGGS